MPINAVILDYGYVLCLPPREEDFEALRRMSGINDGAFRAVYWRHRRDYDCGLLDGPAYWQELAREAGTSLSPEQIEKLMAQDNLLWIHPNPPMLEWVRALRRRGMKTAVISNMPRDISSYLRRTAKWLDVFTHLCFSGELKLCKPDTAIYRSCLASLGVPAEEALFIDDVEANVSGARMVGLHGLVFQSVEKLRADLGPFGLVALPEKAARAK